LRSEKQNDVARKNGGCMQFEKLISILEKSIEKNGEKPLTNKWLLNIVKMADELEETIDACEIDIF